MPTAFEMRQRNAQFAAAAKSGRNPTNPSRKEIQARKSPIPTWAVGLLAFALVGGALFEVARLFF